jgi:hypothetical protein
VTSTHLVVVEMSEHILYLRRKQERNENRCSGSELYARRDSDCSVPFWAARLDLAGRALEVLASIENWSGVDRVYAVRAAARDRMRDQEAAERDREQQHHCESMVVPEAE